MELLIKNIESREDLKLFTELAKRPGLKTSKLSLQEKEEIGLATAVEKSRKTGYVSDESILKTLCSI